MSSRDVVARKLNSLFHQKVNKKAERRLKNPSSDPIPTIDDPFWPEFCRPLLVFILEKDRKWREVSAWGKEQKVNGYFLRNALAWLEDKKYVETYLPEGVESRQGSWVWRAFKVARTQTYAKGG